MSVIKLQCKCGYTFSLPGDLAGQKIRCKRCQKVLKVPKQGAPSGAAPHPSDTDPELMVQGSRACPGCGKIFPPVVVVCVDCGLNLDSGAMLYASLEASKEAQGQGAAQQRGLFARLLSKLGLGKK